MLISTLINKLKSPPDLAALRAAHAKTLDELEKAPADAKLATKERDAREALAVAEARIGRARERAAAERAEEAEREAEGRRTKLRELHERTQASLDVAVQARVTAAVRELAQVVAEVRAFELGRQDASQRARVLMRSCSLADIDTALGVESADHAAECIARWSADDEGKRDETGRPIYSPSELAERRAHQARVAEADARRRAENAVITRAEPSDVAATLARGARAEIGVAAADPLVAALAGGPT